MSRAAAWWVSGAVLVIPLAGLAAWSAVATMADPTASGAAVEPVVVAVDTAQRTPSVTVSLEVVTRPGRQVAAAGAGMVTSVVRAGGVLRGGDEVFTLDDRRVRALQSGRPLWRDLAPGDKGDDVARLQEYLTGLGYQPGAADGRYGAGTGRAVREFNTDAGAAAPVPNVFSLSSVVWIGPGELPVNEVLVAPGVRVTPGTTILTGPGEPVSVKVSEPEGGIADIDGQAVVALGKARVGYQLGSGMVSDPESVAALAGALGPSGKGTAEVAAAQPTAVMVVPASALVTGADGTLCVYPDADTAPVTVSPVGGGNSTVLLPADTALTQVLTNPHAVGVAVECGS